MQNKATDLFSNWAEIGRDQGMAKAHDPAVSEILSSVIREIGREGFATSKSQFLSKYRNIT